MERGKIKFKVETPDEQTGPQPGDPGRHGPWESC